MKKNIKGKRPILKVEVRKEACTCSAHEGPLNDDGQKDVVICNCYSTNFPKPEIPAEAEENLADNVENTDEVSSEITELFSEVSVSENELDVAPGFRYNRRNVLSKPSNCYSNKENVLENYGQ